MNYLFILSQLNLQYLQRRYLMFLMYKYDISVLAWYGSLYDVMNCIKDIHNVPNEHSSNIASIKELCKIRDKVLYSELSPLKANTLIELICTN